MTYKPFNLNDRVRVKLTDAGYEHWQEYYARYNILGPVNSVEQYKEKADANGFVAMQCHEFMLVFGSLMLHGVEAYLDMNIQIQIEGE